MADCMCIIATKHSSTLGVYIQQYLIIMNATCVVVGGSYLKKSPEKGKIHLFLQLVS